MCLHDGSLTTLNTNTAGVFVLWFQDALLNIRHVAIHASLAAVVEYCLSPLSLSSANKKAVGIGHAANISYDWLTFLTTGLNRPYQSLTYYLNLYFPVGPTHPSQGRQQLVAGSPQQAAVLAQGTTLGQLPAAQSQLSRWAADPVFSTSSCVAIYGLQDGEPPIAKRIALLLAQHISQQVADNTNVTVLPDSRGSFAVLASAKLLNLPSKREMRFQLWMGSPGAIASRRCNSADHQRNGNGYKATPWRLQGDNGNVTAPSRGQAGSIVVPFPIVMGTKGGFMDPLWTSRSLRYYTLTFGNEVCTTGLVAMLLSSENGGKAPCPAVYRNAVA
ncbi:TPA: hypothetical protein ACH3X1_010827 [Trebouxia sp. C0004]